MRTVDLFAGCGGMTLGFQNSGFNIIRAYDNWDNAVECYSKNFNHPIFNKDLSNVEQLVDELSLLDIDIIIGGPPCQDFSHAGKRIEGKRADLTQAFAEIVVRLQPSWFVMENVDRAFKSKSYQAARKILKNGNYGLTEVVLDASLCGVPQKRKRFFSIGKLSESDCFLSFMIEHHQCSNPLTLRDYFGTSLKFDHYYRHPRNYNRRGVFSIDEPAPTMRGVNRPIPSGYPGHQGDTAPISSNIRALTTHERALIQTFPEDFIWTGSKTTIEQMIGNAVPVNLAKFLSSIIKKYQNKKHASGREVAMLANF